MRRRPRLLWRIYLYGILMFVLSIVASLAVTQYILQPASQVPTRPSTAWIAWHVADVQDVAQAQAELNDLRERVHIEMTLFDLQGTVRVSSAGRVPAPLTEAELVELRRKRTSFEDGRGRVGIFDKAGVLTGYVLIGYPQVSPLTLALGQLAAALVVLALFAVPFARSIVSPVERLAQVTRAFGQGDFSVRSELAQRRDEVGDLARAFDEMAERITVLRRTELELLANVSHELRTPLSRIRLALELMAEGDTKKSARYVEDIAEELVELEAILDDVMTTARLDRSPVTSREALPPLHLQVIAGREVLDAAAERFRRHHSERALTYRAEADFPTLNADPVLLRRALDNVLDNAAKFSEADSAVELQAKHDGLWLQIDIVDHGIGIAEGEQRSIFEPFYRTDRSRTRVTGGVGLGLALTKRIVEAHGGNIAVISAPSAGSRFVIRIPVEHAAQVAAT